MGMGDLRTKKMDKIYRGLIAKGFLANGCNLCKEKTLKEFRYWKIIKNRFPWDKISKVHHMIIPKRHTIESKLTKAELKEFGLLKKGYIEKNYELIAEATKKKKTIPTHLHLHLIIAKN